MTPLGKKISGCLVFLVLSAGLVGQQVVDSLREANRLLDARGEVCLEFFVEDIQLLTELSGVLSIDSRDGSRIRAYANRQEFDDFLAYHIPFRVIPPEKPVLNQKKSAGEWDSYPSYSEYLDLMAGFAQDHPSLCRLVSAGKSVGNRDILFVKISDHVELEETEPVVLYTSSMHGDETVGYILMLRLIDTLLTGYGTDPRITALVDSLEIWINPLSNPDGTYFNSPTGELVDPKRYNLNDIDLNRNYPDPRAGEFPNGPHQPENIAMMEFMDTLGLSLSVNFHGGAEVVNYPWDTWYPSQKTHSDQSWFQYISREYADTAHLYSPYGYMDPSWSDNGITNGALWYVITGGRQDYVTYFLHGREVTIELSAGKFVSPSLLPLYWEYNRRSLMHYMEQAMFGVHGFVTDAETGAPLQARIEIPGHDSINSEVFSNGQTGYYVRLLAQGEYDMLVYAYGYEPASIHGIQVTNRQQTRLNIALQPDPSGIQPVLPFHLSVYPNPATHQLTLEYMAPDVKKLSVSLLDLNGRRVFSRDVRDITPGLNSLQVPLDGLAPGIYVLQLRSDDRVATIKISRLE